MDQAILDKISAMLSMATTASDTIETPVQTVQLEGVADEVLDDVEHVGTYGFSSSVPAGAQVLMGCIGGNRDMPFVLAIGHNEFRPVDMETGESVMYSKFANEVRLNKNGEIVFNSGEDYAVAFNELKIAFDQLKADHDSLASKHNSHIHVTTATIGASATLGVLSATVAPEDPSTADMADSKVEKVRI